MAWDRVVSHLASWHWLCQYGFVALAMPVFVTSRQCSRKRNGTRPSSVGGNYLSRHTTPRSLAGLTTADGNPINCPFLAPLGHASCNASQLIKGRSERTPRLPSNGFSPTHDTPTARPLENPWQPGCIHLYRFVLSVHMSLARRVETVETQ